MLGVGISCKDDVLKVPVIAKLIKMRVHDSELELSAVGA